MTAYTAASAVFSALADPTRRAIFERIARQPQSVGQLSAGLPVSRPAVSQHLKVLKQARLVSDHADGSRRIYRMDPQGIADLRGYLDHFWNEALAAFRDAVHQPSQPGGDP